MKLVRPRQSPSLRYLLAWYVTSISLLLLLPSWKSGAPIWQMPQAQWQPAASLAAAFAVSASIAVLLRPMARWQAVLLAFVCTAAAYGVVFLGFLITKTDYYRTVTLGTFACAVLLVPAPYIIGSSRLNRAAFGVFVALVAAGPYALSFAGQRSGRSAALIKTEFYNLDTETYTGAFPAPAVQGGALGRIGDRYMLVTGEGRLYVFGWETTAGELQVTPLPYRVPVNGDAFAETAGRPWRTPPSGTDQTLESARSTSGEILNSEWFRVYGLLVQETGSDARVFVSHAYWHADKACWTERVSMLRADRDALLRGAAGGEWKMLYETQPCLPTQGQDRRHGIPFVGYFGGGRLALLDPQTLLLAVGDFGFDGLASAGVQAQDPTTSYGKTVAIDIADGRATLFTIGHRNPEGLFVDRSGTTWSTEHGPQGGDELNRLVRGSNYGWPYATYGTDYSAFSWPLNKPEQEWKAYQAPAFAWVPSIGVSNLIAVEQGLFPEWRGDLLIASLRAQTLFRARVRDGHVAYLEPIAIGSRIRDLIEGPDGRIVLWTDSNSLISIRPKESTTGEALFAEKCSGCHQSKLVSANRIGPNLSGVVGRRIASLGSYPDYTSCLRGLEGEWTAERLDSFLAAPRTVCPGTAMDFSGLANAADRAAIIRYLGTLGS